MESRLARDDHDRMLLSFERPATAGSSEHPSGPGECGGTALLFTDLENCTVANVNGYHRAQLFGAVPIEDHRQDSKGTRWMPWHQESMKDVNGCDKPR
jgi:hypothetical protein